MSRVESLKLFGDISKVSDKYKSWHLKDDENEIKDNRKLKTLLNYHNSRFDHIKEKYDFLSYQTKNELKNKSKYDEYKALKYYCDIYKYKGETDISIEYLIKCIEIVSKLDEEKILGNLYIELGQLYSGISKEKELECYQKGITIFKDLEII